MSRKTGDGAATGPSVDSDVQAERIAARRARIAARKLAEERAAHPERFDDAAPPTGNPALDPEAPKSKAQIARSLQVVDALREDATEKVTLVRVTADFAEGNRRASEDEARAARRAKLEADRRQTVEMFAAVTDKWDAALANKHAEDLHVALEEQKAGCKALIDSKEQLIESFQLELKKRDDEYVRDLRAQSADVETILSAMDEQVKAASAAYREQLEEIETAFMMERQEMIEAARKEWEAAMGKRKEEEESCIKAMEDRTEEHHRQLEHLRLTDEEEYATVKKKLETDVQNLQQQLQSMKATYLLNTEKLEYNFQVLQKRDEENAVTKSQQKRKTNRLHDVLTSLKAKLAKQEAQLALENQAVVEDYQRVTDQVADLQHKYRHFREQDQRQFDEVFAMNAETNSELAKRVLACDRVIAEQQLGLQWVPPEQSVFDPPLSAAEAAAGPTASQIASRLWSDTGDVPADVPVPPAVARAALGMLTREAGFLVEEKLDQLLAPLPEDQQVMVKLDTIFKALGVDSEADVFRLCKYLIVDDQPAQDPAREGQEEQAAAAVADEVQFIHPNDIPAALRTFVDDSARDEGTRVGAATVAPNESTKFWKQLEGVVDKEQVAVWGALSDGLAKYKEILGQRAAAIDEAAELRQQNEELHRLLQQYMGSKVSQELVVPPRAVLENMVSKGTAAVSNA